MKRHVRSLVRVNTYEVMARAVENGIAHGWARAHKHGDAPSETELCSHMHQQVMNAICEVFTFDGEVEP